MDQQNFGINGLQKQGRFIIRWLKMVGKFSKAKVAGVGVGTGLSLIQNAKTPKMRQEMH